MKKLIRTKIKSLTIKLIKRFNLNNQVQTIKFNCNNLNKKA